MSASITPSLGVVGLTTFTAHVDARDPDGDPLSISWSDGARRVVGDTVDLTFKAGHDVLSPLTVTVSDGKGGTASARLDFLAGDINCYCDGFFGPEQGLERFFVRLTSIGTTVTGTITDLKTGQVGTIDAAQPGRIDADGQFRIRFKFPLYGGDFLFDGRLVPYDKPIVGQFLTDYAFTGRVSGGKFDGHTVTFGEHNPY